MSKHERSSSQDDALRHPSTKRAKEIDEHTPMEQLNEVLKHTKGSHGPRNVLHWFRSKDLRMHDNKGLHAASKKAKEGKGHTLCLYVFSPKDMDWHGTSPARTDFILQSMQLLKDELAQKHIPLVCVTAEERRDKVAQVMKFVEQNNVSHVYANIEYEVDELRRDIKFAHQVRDHEELSFEAFHDQTVMKPGALTTGSGGPIKVFTPYHKAWLAEVAENPQLIGTVDPPLANESSASKDMKKLYESNVPSLPESKAYASKEDEKRIRKLWPAGHQAGIERLEHFLKKKVDNYMRDRSDAAKDPSSRLSPFFASGVLSVREALTAAAEHNETGANFSESGNPGVSSWVREIVFREFYRQMLVITPHDSMNLPHNLKFDFVQWEDDEEGWKKWCDGMTGMPFVDAGMRQLKQEAYMHNRLRMNVSSYLRTNLLIDYRKGERFFAENLVDWDLSNNTQGWYVNFVQTSPAALD